MYISYLEDVYIWGFEISTYKSVFIHADDVLILFLSKSSNDFQEGQIHSKHIVNDES